MSQRRIISLAAEVLVEGWSCFYLVDEEDLALWPNFGFCWVRCEKI
jgi:hypothetical protein